MKEALKNLVNDANLVGVNFKELHDLEVFFKSCQPNFKPVQDGLNGNQRLNF